MRFFSLREISAVYGRDRRSEFFSEQESQIGRNQKVGSVQIKSGVVNFFNKIQRNRIEMLDFDWMRTWEMRRVKFWGLIEVSICFS